jgi:micrococcal nuclease
MRGSESPQQYAEWLLGQEQKQETVMGAKKFEPYVYQAEVVSVYDADTVTLDVDLGFNVTTEQKFRLYGIDAWEMRGGERSKGTIARDWLRGQIPDGSTVYIKTEKDKQGKYGRYLATIHKDIGGGSLNVKLVELGHAVFKEY